MAGLHRFKINCLDDHIKKYFSEFDFFQLVHLLDFLYQQEMQSAPDNHAFLTQRHLHFHPQIDLNYRSNSVTNLTETTSGTRIEINFIGLIGPGGALPQHYNADLIENDKNRALYDFLNIFNHRLISLYFLAWRKYRLHLSYKIDLSSDLAGLLKSFSGLLPTRKKAALLNLDLQNSLLYFSGFNAKVAKTAEGLENLLQHTFSVPIKIEAFKGNWESML